MKSKKNIKSFKTEVNNQNSKQTRITVDLDEETYKRLKLLVKKYNYKSHAAFNRDLINRYYEDFFTNKGQNDG